MAARFAGARSAASALSKPASSKKSMTEDEQFAAFIPAKQSKKLVKYQEDINDLEDKMAKLEAKAAKTEAKKGKGDSEYKKIMKEHAAAGDKRDRIQAELVKDVAALEKEFKKSKGDMIVPGRSNAVKGGSSRGRSKSPAFGRELNEQAKLVREKIHGLETKMCTLSNDILISSNKMSLMKKGTKEHNEESKISENLAKELVVTSKHLRDAREELAVCEGKQRSGSRSKSSVLAGETVVMPSRSPKSQSSGRRSNSRNRKNDASSELALNKVSRGAVKKTTASRSKSRPARANSQQKNTAKSIPGSRSGRRTPGKVEAMEIFTPVNSRSKSRAKTPDSIGVGSPSRSPSSGGRRARSRSTSPGPARGRSRRGPSRSPAPSPNSIRRPRPQAINDLESDDDSSDEGAVRRRVRDRSYL